MKVFVSSVWLGHPVVIISLELWCGLLSGDGWLVACDINVTKFSVRLDQDWKFELRASNHSLLN